MTIAFTPITIELGPIERCVALSSFGIFVARLFIFVTKHPDDSHTFTQLVHRRLRLQLFFAALDKAFLIPNIVF